MFRRTFALIISLFISSISSQALILKDSISFEKQSSSIDRNLMISIGCPFLIDSYETENYSGIIFTRGISLSIAGIKKNKYYIGGTILFLLSKDAQFGTTRVPYEYSDIIGADILFGYIFKDTANSHFIVMPGAVLGFTSLSESAGSDYDNWERRGTAFGGPFLKLSIGNRIFQVSFKHTFLFGETIINLLEPSLDFSIHWKKDS